MKTKKLKKSEELKARLIKLGCFDEFCENLKKQRNITFEEFVYTDGREYLCYSSLIIHAFTWYGFEPYMGFWHNIYDKIDKV